MRESHLKSSTLKKFAMKIVLILFFLAVSIPEFQGSGMVGVSNLIAKPRVNWDVNEFILVHNSTLKF